jgi:putative FmdB family regulatory protein
VPTYEYHCDTCDRNFDVVQSFHDDPLTACPTCDSPVRKVFGSVGIVFKGSGFYKNDSRDGKGRSGASKDDRGEDTKSGSSDLTSADKKPAGAEGGGPATSESRSNGSGSSSGDGKPTPKESPKTSTTSSSSSKSA